MFERFRERFAQDGRDQRPTPQLDSQMPDELRELFLQFGGGSFCEGMYRVVHPADLPLWEARLESGFADLRTRLTSFAYDWLGRLFALDHARTDRGMMLVIMLEPGTGEALEIPANLVSFHNDELINASDAALAASGFKDWRLAGRPAPARNQCIGYRHPLFLGGVDDFSNMELSDIDVYWHLMGQLITKTRGLPPGTPIRIAMEE